MYTRGISLVQYNAENFSNYIKKYKMYDLLHNITLKQTRACWRPNNIMNSEKK